MRSADRRPVHIVDEWWSSRSRCGVKDPLPVVYVEFVQRHIDGYGMPVCEKCAEGGWPGKASDG